MKRRKNGKHIKLERLPNESSSISERSEASDINETEDENKAEENMDQNPQSLSLTSIYHMFIDLKKQLSKIPAENEKSKRELKKECIVEVSKAANEMIQHECEEVRVLKQDLARYKHKTEVLTDIVNRMHMKQEDFRQKFESLELSNSKKMITISGMQIDGDKDNLMETVQVFFDEFFERKLTVEDAI